MEDDTYVMEDDTRLNKLCGHLSLCWAMLGGKYAVIQCHVFKFDPLDTNQNMHTFSTMHFSSWEPDFLQLFGGLKS
jgi:hypothetical protein